VVDSCFSDNEHMRHATGYLMRRAGQPT
jgi:hypothetical protein